MSDLWILLANAAFFLLVAAVYFVPAWVAHHRRHRNAALILMVNIFTGWTIAGWFVALAWALLGDHADAPPAAVPATKSR
jgi:uncharacterized membrane protein